MTTIAFDGKTLATDSLVTYDDMRAGTINKIANVVGGILATAGNQEDGLLVVQWFKAGRKETRPVLTSFVGLFIPNDGSAPQEFGEKLIPMAIPKFPWVAGTGKSFALAAMLAGKDAVEAVRIAIQLDIYSGGDVNCYEMDKQHHYSVATSLDLDSWARSAAAESGKIN